MRALLLAVVLAGVLDSGPVTVVGKVKSWSCIGPRAAARSWTGGLAARRTVRGCAAGSGRS